MSDTKAVKELPPSPLQEWSFSDGNVQTTAKLAKFIPGEVDRLYTFGAHHVQVGEYELVTPTTVEDEEWQELRAYYSGDENEVIVYYLENWATEAETGIAACFPVLEMHELTHWAVPQEDNEDDIDHWKRWNHTLTEVVEYVMDIEMEIAEYEPPEVEPPKADRQTRQTTFSDISR